MRARKDRLVIIVHRLRSRAEIIFKKKKIKNLKKNKSLTNPIIINIVTTVIIKNINGVHGLYSS